RLRPPPRPPLFPYTTLFRSVARTGRLLAGVLRCPAGRAPGSALGAGLRAATDALGCSGSKAKLCPGRGTLHSSSVTTEPSGAVRSEEHTSELQSRENLVCRL